MKPGFAIAINVVAFQALWTLAAFGAGEPWWWVAPVSIGLSMAGQLRLSPFPGREAALILVGAAVGTSADWLGAAAGMFRPATPSSAAFVILFFSLWMNFGTTLRPSLAWLWRRTILAAVLGAVAGPCTYWVGSRIGIIAFNEPLWKGLAWVSAQYAVALPAWMLAARRVIPAQGGTDRRSSEPGATR